jgi:hypothetical protein
VIVPSVLSCDGRGDHRIDKIGLRRHGGNAVELFLVGSPIDARARDNRYEQQYGGLR